MNESGRRAYTMNPNMWQNYYCPSVSDSSLSPVSTSHSSSVSMRSEEASPIAGMPMLQSPELFHSQFSGNATNHLKPFPLEDFINARAQSFFLPIVEDMSPCHVSHLDVSRSVDTSVESLVKSKQKLVQEDGSKRLSDTHWASVYGTDEFWASASSQELLWNSYRPAPESDTDEMPRLTPDTSPILHMHISRQDNDRRDRDVSNQERRGYYRPNRETREHCAYSQSSHEGWNRSRWRSAIQPITHDEEGCRHACHTAAMEVREGPLNFHIHLSTKLCLDSDAKCRKYELSSLQAGRACQPLISRVETVTDCDTIRHRKAQCSTSVVDTSLSSFSRGHFRIVEQDGTPCYSFSVHDSKEVFFARACRPESGFYGDNTNNGFHYAFHCRREDKAKGGWNCCFRKEKLSSILVANMKISAVGNRIDRNRHIEEAHFVLYTESFQHSAAEEEANEEDLVTRSSKAILLGQKSMEKSMIQKERVWIELLAVAITMYIELKKHKDASNSSHGSSRIQGAAGWDAASVDRSSEKGWGVEFLSKSSKNFTRSKVPIQQKKVQEPQLGDESLEIVSCTHLENLQGSRVVNESRSTYHPMLLNERLKSHYSVNNKHKELEKAVDVVVLLPAGCHGLKGDEDGNCAGPTPLLDCWRLNGSCDCGGWDMGCGMSVLRAETLRLHKRSTIALTNRDRINWILPGRPFVIFSQGYKRRKLLTIDIIEAGLFSLSFQAQFSPLQAFATAVAIFHQQMTLQ